MCVSVLKLNKKISAIKDIERSDKKGPVINNNGSNINNNSDRLRLCILPIIKNLNIYYLLNNTNIY